MGMRYVILIGDGMADYPIPERGNKTALQIASTPNLDFIALEGKCGLVKTIPESMPAGSDIAALSILGYDPTEFYTGRGPLEAMGMDLPLAEGDIAFRCNFITESEGILEDFSGGHIQSEEARPLIAALNAELRDKWSDKGWDITFHPGISYRNLLVIKSQSKDFEFADEKEIGGAPPHDIVGEGLVEQLPKEDILKDLVLASKDVLDAHEVNAQRMARNERKANMVWLWSGGKKPAMPSFRELYGVHGSVVSGVDLIRGIGNCVGLGAIEVPGATGYFDTNYKGKAEYALRSLGEADFVLVHVEAPDEGGHLHDIDLKVKAIEDFDALVVGTVLKGLEEKFADTDAGYRILVMPDHYTPVSVGTHTREPVPFAIYDSRAQSVKEKESGFDERSAKNSADGVLNARSQELMRLFFQMK